jgi:nucleoside-diphosphate-sugar epimerase
MAKRVLITGGAGFLGTHSIEKYLSEGFDVTVIDNFTTPTVLDSNPLLQSVELIKQDVLSYKWQSKQYDLIVHLASPVGPAGILKHSGKMAKYILEDIYWGIEGAKVNDCPLVFVSTSEIYGYRDKAVYLKEDDYKILVGNYKVRNEYAMAKLTAEVVLSNTAKVSDIKFQIIRPFNISGARQLKDGGFVLPTFMVQALDNNPITVFGDGQQVRAFTHVKDIVDGIFLTSVSDKMNDIWNVGNKDNIVTIHGLAQEVLKKVPESTSQITLVDPKTIHGPLYEEAWDKIPDATKIIETLGWKPKYNVTQIIDDVYNYYKK